MTRRPRERSGLRESVLYVLEINSSRCMDSDDDRQALADAIVDGIKSGWLNVR